VGDRFGPRRPHPLAPSPCYGEGERTNGSLDQWLVPGSPPGSTSRSGMRSLTRADCEGARERFCAGVRTDGDGATDDDAMLPHDTVSNARRPPPGTRQGHAAEPYAERAESMGASA